MTIAEWIRQEKPRVPDDFIPWLRAREPVSPEGFLDAAIRKIDACATSDPRDRVAAFALLAADAYITYACLWALRQGGGAAELRRVTSELVERRP